LAAMYKFLCADVLLLRATQKTCLLLLQASLLRTSTSGSEQSITVFTGSHLYHRRANEVLWCITAPAKCSSHFIYLHVVTFQKSAIFKNKNNFKMMRFGAVFIFWDVTPCGLVETYYMRSCPRRRLSSISKLRFVSCDVIQHSFLTILISDRWSRK